MVKIEIWSDINCPFCYIGKRHLEKALSDFDGEVEIEWKSFELDPFAHPVKGSDQTELLAKKYGKPLEWAKEMNAQITEKAREVGLQFRMDQVVPANTFNAHRLLHLAKKYALQNEMKERLLKARFEEGLDVGDLMVLPRLGEEIGLKPEDMKELFNSHRYANEVREEEEKAAELGIRGVPFFVFNGKYAVSGAQPVEVFKSVLEKLK